MIVKFDLFENKEFVEKWYLNKIVNPFFSNNYEDLDMNGVRRKLRKIFRGNWCKFEASEWQDEDLKLDSYVIEGIVTDTFAYYFYEPSDLVIRFQVNGIDYPVDPDYPIFVHLKEERKKPRTNPELDPYGEEDWDEENESVKEKKNFSIGDVVVCNGSMDDIDFNGEIGTIVDIGDSTKPYAHVEFETRFSEYLWKEPGRYDKYGYDIFFEFLEHANLEISDKIKKKREELRLKMIEIDPYGEEDWLEESLGCDFKLGDRVEYIGYELSRRLRKNNLGTVIKVWGGGEYGVQFDENIGGHDCQINGKWGHCWNVNKYELRHTDPEKIEKRKRKQEELRLKYKDIDPYGEEDWETNESVKYIKTDLTVNIYEVGTDYLNKNFTNCWVKISPELREYLIRIDKFEKKRSFIVIHYSSCKYEDREVRHINYPAEYNLAANNTITKYEEKMYGQIFTELDPYGEEEWDV